MKVKQAGRGMTMLALTAALGAAVYLNWSFSQQTPQTISADDTAQDAVSVSAEADAETQAVQGEAEDTVAVYDPLTAEDETVS